MMHNHDTNETFIPMTGVWRCSWENKEGKVESVDLRISCPAVQPEDGHLRSSATSSSHPNLFGLRMA